MASEIDHSKGILRWVKWGVISALLLILYGEVMVKWGEALWNDDNYSHGMLIPFVSLYIIWSRMTQLREIRIVPYAAGILFVVVGLLLFSLGYVGGEQFSKRLSFIVVLYGLILFLEGKEVASIMHFPVWILFFSVPLPYVLYNAMAFPLKLIATKVAVFLLSLYGMPAFKDGNIIYLSHTTLEVVDACSGIRSLMTLITLAFFLACMMHKNTVLRALVLLFAVPVAVLANALRVALNGILASYNPAWSEGFWHEFSGWLVFIVSFALLWIISFLLKWKGLKKLVE